MTDILSRYQTVSQAIERARLNANRRPGSIDLLAVSKTKPAEQLRSLYSAGQRDFGENYLQEALDKIEQLADLDICWHFIGPIQSNKTRPIAEHFHWVQSVDRVKIAQRLSGQRPSHLPPLNICIQVNISQEASKSGCLPSELPNILQQCAELPNIRLRGLMAIPKQSDTDHSAFADMRALLTQAQQNYPNMDTLSMGMSNDMDHAIAQGATMIRIGTALFGARN